MFLFNVSQRHLHGVFICDEVGLDLQPDAWRGRFPAQVINQHHWHKLQRRTLNMKVPPPVQELSGSVLRRCGARRLQASVHVWAACEPLHINAFIDAIQCKKKGMIPNILQYSEVQAVFQRMQVVG